MKNSCLSNLLVYLLFWLSILQLAHADEGLEYFEKNIRPVLIEHCYECHSASSDTVRGKLRVDSRKSIRLGGESGPAVVPHMPEKSLLLSAIRHESLEMPPGQALPSKVVAQFQQWIAMGAPDPRDHPPTTQEVGRLSWEAILKSRRDWWSIQPLPHLISPPPSENHWSQQAIDLFIQQKLVLANLRPAKRASGRTLIRRLFLVLHGIPPQPHEVEAFLKAYQDNRELAYQNLVDRLLQSPHFGERWARHWLDIVRYTETHGNEWNYEVHHAWQYRDYLIRAMNLDIPYDQLVREHIAGDLLPNPRWSCDGSFNESIIGTAFYRFGEANHDDCVGLSKIGYDLLDNRIDTLSKAFQSTTIACARCHDHKLDAISTKDYYALAGILRSSRLVAHTIDAPWVNAKPMHALEKLKVEIRKEIGKRWLQNGKNLNYYLVAAEDGQREQPGHVSEASGLERSRLEKWVALLDVDPSEIESLPLNNPLTPWLTLGANAKGNWDDLARKYFEQQQARMEFNRKNFQPFVDFRDRQSSNWHASGHGLRSGPTKSGEFCVARTGNRVVADILPAGYFTHTLSDKLNGRLLSPLIEKSRKRISFQVLGGQTSAVRLVTNNCQLNYANYRALSENKLQWITLTPPQDLHSARVYAELVTKFDNPKYPDPLGKLGGDTKNESLPWIEAIASPSSYFGITHAVEHDCEDTPKSDLTYLLAFFKDQGSTPPKTRAELASRYRDIVEQAIRNWTHAEATDHDVCWLDWLLKNELLDNSMEPSTRLSQLVAEYRRVEQSDLAMPRIVPGLGDFDTGFDQPVFIRGDHAMPGAVVPRRYLEVLSTPGENFTRQGSGRLELAHRIASPDNPLTARVLVNRIWHHLFGFGLVRTVDDFGHVGELPSHPELLDYLARGLINYNWSMKELIREIVCSKTFQMTHRKLPEAIQTDPLNRLLHHYPARRLDAEAIRDSILATSGRLDRTLYGHSISPYREEANVTRRLFAGPLDGKGRRSIYTKMTLMEKPPFLGNFNLPGGKVTQGRRDSTHAAAQALTLLNDPFVVDQADYWSRCLTREPSHDLRTQIQRMFYRALGRPPTPTEVDAYLQLIYQLADAQQVQPDQLSTDPRLWKDISHVIFNLQEFITIP